MMEDRKKLGKEELIAHLPSSGWQLSGGTAPAHGTLEETARAAYDRHQHGGGKPILKRLEDALELDLIELQEIWEHLGLPH